MISLSARATNSYRGGQFQRNVIDNAVPNSLDELLAACPNLTAGDVSRRVDVAIDVISDTTASVLETDAAARRSGDKQSRLLRKPAVKVTAADLSQELSSQEGDRSVARFAAAARAGAVAVPLDIRGGRREAGCNAARPAHRCQPAVPAPTGFTQRFLLKAYAIDADKDAAGLHDHFHIGAPLDIR